MYAECYWRETESRKQGTYTPLAPRRQPSVGLLSQALVTTRLRPPTPQGLQPQASKPCGLDTGECDA